MEIPRLGFGTYQMDEREECVEAVELAMETGYEHVDTAQGYDNEEYVAEGLDASGVDRDEVFVATKLDTDNLAADDVVETAQESAERLGTDSIDLLYVHWPINTYDPEETLPALDELVDDGLVERVGLSNFRPDQMREAIETLDAPVYAHQVEMHPMLPQEELHELAVEEDHQLVAYCPIARGKVADVPEIRQVAEKHDATAAQVSLAWLMDKENVTAIPKAASPDHVEENYESLELELDDEDRETIGSIETRERIVDFDDAPWNQV
ncbi:aldo/keto reductase [Halogeometricum sp. CBA1124]|uniref:aldo/keto reductase n=1 Tax=Halogeometricum sp. CBA1124 TaxID=2668071 RepID=UPI001429FB87|nr:aldo/keto reductase [Halogeometricum sp. CBA1124]MUV57934.1 aldo/keto reductase [Halogeometricum sp. CBA1124]